MAGGRKGVNIMTRINPFYDNDGNRIYSGWETDYFDHIEHEEKEELEENETLSL
jgi:hypothetical protein